MIVDIRRIKCKNNTRNLAFRFIHYLHLIFPLRLHYLNLSKLFIIFLLGIAYSDSAYAEVGKKDDAAVKLGKIIYTQNCKYCHQENGIGKPGVAPSLINQEFLSIASDKFLLDTIVKGRSGTGMPPFSHLDKTKVNAIVEYLRSNEKIPSRIKEIQAQPKSTGNVRKGKTLFNDFCAGCHGPNGDGYSSGGTGTAIGKKVFLQTVSDGFIRATIKSGRSNTRMRSFQGPDGLANLSDDEIENVIAYLRTIPSH